MPSSGFTVNNTDLDNILVPKSYLIDRYPELSATYKTAGLWSWGQGTSGQNGDSGATSRSSPVQTISFSSNWKTVSSGRDHKAAIKTDGTLWLWGLGTSGQLGNNAAAAVSSPVQTISAGTNWKQVSCGEGHTGAIKTDGTLWMWGAGTTGQMGNNAATARSSPVQTISAGTNWKQVSCGYFSVMAIKTDGTLWGWGGATTGELGNNVATINRSSPVQTIALGSNWKQVSCGKSFSAAVKTDGTLWLWGANNGGQLGDNTTVNKSSPVQTVSAGTNWKQVSCGYKLTTAIKTDGTLWTWGDNTLGKLGDNTTVNKSSPAQTVSAGTNWAIVSAGLSSAAAIKTDGTLWTWGRNNEGSVGDNTTLSRSSPVQTVAGGTDWKFIAPWGGYWTSLSAIRDDSADFGIGSM